jgi:hypothetical protein
MVSLRVMGKWYLPGADVIVKLQDMHKPFASSKGILAVAVSVSLAMG